MSCDPSDTDGNCTVILAVGRDTNTIGTRILIRFRRPVDKLVPMSLAVLCRCNSECRRIVPPFRRLHRCAALRNCDYFCTLVSASGTNFQSSPFPERLRAAQIARSFDDPSRSAHISGYCNRIRPIGTRIVSGKEMEMVLVEVFGCFEVRCGSKWRQGWWTNLVQTSRQTGFFCAGVDQCIVSAADDFVRDTFEGPWSHAYVIASQLEMEWKGGNMRKVFKKFISLFIF